jgi:hypothetical protein
MVWHDDPRKPSNGALLLQGANLADESAGCVEIEEYLDPLVDHRCHEEIPAGFGAPSVA